MSPYEFRTMTIGASGYRGGKVDLVSLNKRLNKMGRRGWELISMTGTSKEKGDTQQLVFVFRRERTP